MTSSPPTPSPADAGTAPPPQVTKLRSGAVLVTALASGLVLVASLWRPPSKVPLLGQQPYQFPTTVAMSGWQQVSSQPIRPLDNAPALAARHYRFMRQGQTLEAQVWYLRYVEGNVSRFLNVYAQVASTLQQKPLYQPDIGHAGLLTTPERVYLSSCVNSQGPTTLTESQFAQNRYEYDLKPARIFSWLLGQQDLMDRRCFFTVLSATLASTSTPTTPATAKPRLNAAQAQQLLQNFWPLWHQWLQSQVPPS